MTQENKYRMKDKESLESEAYDRTFKLAMDNEKLLTLLGFSGLGVPVPLHSLMIASYIEGCKMERRRKNKNNDCYENAREKDNS